MGVGDGRPGGTAPAGRVPGVSAQPGGPRVPGAWPRLSAVQLVPISRLLPADSPRRRREDPAHVRLLAEADGQFPPIVVHRRTMRVVDGTHRLRVARVRGRSHIEARLLDGSPEEAFVYAVEANTSGGLPLTVAERTAAAARIFRSHPRWSDRAVAAVTGLSAKTVAAHRRRLGGDAAHSASRVGRDGRVRPLNSAEGRLLASRIIAASPEASLREVAAKAGISPGTVRDVRDRLRRGEDPVPLGQRRTLARIPEQPTAPARPPARLPAREPAEAPPAVAGDARSAVFRSLCRDPSLRHTETGRLLLRMMEPHIADSGQWDRLADSLPTHCADTISAMATACAEVWQEFALRLRDSARRQPPVSAPDERGVVRGRPLVTG
ncbi:ParB N-terminal domain-containing protein [Streptomyces sp. OF3]|uniref:ParB N-terminal domain-containing protein n=1 Tax=Streptomyces alkaliterrae TaxID=2213162 RepID=A0A7W3WPP1_9ACTN|nr:ParB N-terminal domain-containing protein [Streptomyces alkaliterrae]